MYLNYSIPSASSISESSHLKLIDLNNYYTSDQERPFINCQICNCSISREEIFEHTVSKRHKYNKLFVAILQDCSKNADVDFIVLSIDRIRCRYCETVISNSQGDGIIINHIQDARHLRRKQDWLNRVSGSSTEAPTVGCELLQPLDSLVMHNKIYGKSIKKSAKQTQKTKSLQEKISKKCITKELEATNHVDQNNILQYSTFSKNFELERGEALPAYIIIGNGATCMCTICLIEIPKTTYNVGGHIDGKKHKQKNSQSVTKSMGEFTKIAIGGFYICPICLLLVPNHPHNIKVHNNGKKHKQLMMA